MFPGSLLLRESGTWKAERAADHVVFGGERELPPPKPGRKQKVTRPKSLRK